MGHNIITGDNTGLQLLNYSNAWLKSDVNIYSDDYITACVNNDAIQTWKDCRGAGYNAAFRQGTAANKPIYRTGGLASKPYINYVDTTDLLTAHSTTLQLLRKFTITAVYYFATAGGTTSRRIMSVGSSYYVWHTSDIGYYGFWDTTNRRLTSQAGLSGNAVVTWMWDASSMVAKVFRNGAQIGSNIDISGSITYNFSSASWNVGTNFAGLNLYEIAVHTNSLSDSEIQSIHTYLNSIYSIY